MATPPGPGPIQRFENRAMVLLDLHHLILYGVLALALFAISYLWSSWRASQADQRAAVAEAKAQAADKQNAAFQQQVSQQLAEIKTEREAKDQQIQQLTSALAARNRQLQGQQQKDAQLPPVDLALRWTGLIKQPGSVTFGGTTFAVTPTGALATVQTLESVPVLEADKQGLETTVADLQQNVAGGDRALALEQQAHTSDNATSVLNLAAKDAEIKKVKADCAKSKRKWGIVGVVVGVIVGIAAYVH